MPSAVVISLQALDDGVIRGALGQHAHGYWLSSWRALAPAVGDELHDDRPLRQFTVSPLLGLGDTRHGRTPVYAGDTAALRLTALDDTTQAALLGDWVLRAPDPATIGGVRWQRQRVARSPDDHPAAGSDTYAQLRDRAAAEPPPHRWDLSLTTPTAFHLGDERYLPFPLPRLLVGGWLERWLAYAPTPVLPPRDSPAAFLDRVEAALLISRYRLKTVTFRLRFDGAETPQIGCVGRLTLDGRALAAADRSAVGALAAFAFYCGSGHHTTMGMGQTRPETAA